MAECREEGQLDMWTMNLGKHVLFGAGHELHERDDLMADDGIGKA